jgi:hypothetical protein
LSGAPQVSTLGPPLFNIFINDLSDRINHSKFLLFADDPEIYRDIKSGEDCKALKTDIDLVHQWCENCMELNIQKTKIISFTHKMKSINLNYHVSDVLILHSDCLKDLGVMLDSKLYFHCHTDFVYCQELRTLGAYLFYYL